MKKTIAITATALIAVGALSACKPGGVNWEAEVRAETQAGLDAKTPEERAQLCDSMEMLGMTTADDLVEFIMPMSMSMTPEDYAAVGIPLIDDPTLLDGVATEDVMRASAEVTVDYCGF